MIETDIKSIKKHQTISRTKTAGEIKVLSSWQLKHARENNKQFKAITDALKLLPSEDVILKSISDNIKIVVNGKIDAISTKVDLVGDHLLRQDTAIEAINLKIKPVIGSMEWLNGLMNVVLYVGGIAAAAYGILKVLEIIKIIK
jgi:hypothetical protein